jgi:hypothetical protein
VTSYPNPGSTTLSNRHRHALEEGSAISREVLEENDVYTIAHGRELPEGFSGRQRKRGPGILFTVTRPNGETSYSFRPDAPDPKNPGRKYEQPCKALGGPGNVLSVPAGQRHLIGDLGVPVIYVEGIKKALSIISAARRAGVEVLVAAISGVWNFLSDGEPISDLLEIPVEGREVGIVFDSDFLTNPGVQGAGMRLAETEAGRGAVVRLAYLPDAPDGSKVGADDYLVSGKSYAELRMTMRAYDPKDFELIKLSRDDKLRGAFEDLERRHSDTVWTWPGADADEDLLLALAGAARKHGKIHADGIRVKVSWGTLALEAKIGSSRTVGKGLARLQERGFLYRDNEGREDGKAGAFVLRASVKQVGEGSDKEEKATTSLRGCDPGTLHPRSPRLWASRPKFKPTKKMIREHRLGTRSHLPEPREGVTRLGKKRSHVFDRLDAAGGTLRKEELGKLLGVRPRDLTRRKKSPKGRDGLLVWPEEAGIIVVEGDAVTLADNWLDRLEEVRERGEELEADGRAEKDRRRRSRAYRDHLAERRRTRPHSSKPTAAGLAAVERSHEKRAEHIAAHDEHQAKVRAAETERKRFVKRFVHDRLRALGRIRLGLLQEALRDEGGTPSYALPAAKSLGCTVERLPEYANEEFIFAPHEWAS